MSRIKNIQDVVDWGLCVGCGACYAFCRKPDAVKLINIENVGIRPRFNRKICRDCNECLDICSGYCTEVDSQVNTSSKTTESNLLIGSTYQVWEGHATDPEIRFTGSSGGILTALALYALEKEKMSFVLHTGTDPERPWLNKTMISRKRTDLLHNAGSRYAASSPCEFLHIIEESDRPCVFIGKPCDAAAVSMVRKLRPQLDAKLGLILSFFCAGTPCTKATLDLLHENNIDPDQVDSLRYRGEGWPGNFKIVYDNAKNKKEMSYMDSWNKLSRQRPFRCQLCPDGLGEKADITSGDAWSKYDINKSNLGLSQILVRSLTGRDILRRAMDAGYVSLQSSLPENVIESQGLTQRRREVFGRCLAMRLLGIPVPRFKNFNLFKAWCQNTLNIKLRSIIGTLRRLLQRGLWHRNPLF